MGRDRKVFRHSPAEIPYQDARTATGHKESYVVGSFQADQYFHRRPEVTAERESHHLPGPEPQQPPKRRARQRAPLTCLGRTAGHGPHRLHCRNARRAELRLESTRHHRREMLIEGRRKRLGLSHAQAAAGNSSKRPRALMNLRSGREMSVKTTRRAKSSTWTTVVPLRSGRYFVTDCPPNTSLSIQEA